MEVIYDQYVERLCICLEDMEELKAVDVARREILDDALDNKTSYIEAMRTLGGFRYRARKEGLIKEHGLYKK